MSKFSVNDTVLITEGLHAGDIGNVTMVADGKYAVRTDDRILSFYVREDALEYVNPDYCAITEMATVARMPATSKYHALRIEVNPDRKRKGVPYFKVMNTESYQKGKSKVCRLHFLDEGMEFHTGDGLLDWRITDKDIKEIKNVLSKPHKRESNYTIWQMACYLWNMEYGLIPDEVDKYFNGEYDDSNKNHPSYVPSNQTMPKGWVCDQHKGKK